MRVGNVLIKNIKITKTVFKLLFSAISRCRISIYKQCCTLLSADITTREQSCLCFGSTMADIISDIIMMII